MGKDRRQAREREEKEEKMRAIERLKRAREGKHDDEDDDYANENADDDDIFEYLDENEYEKRVAEKRSNNFIVDDVDGDYEDDGEDVWDSRYYDDDDDIVRANEARNKKRQRLSEPRKKAKKESDGRKLSEMFGNDDDAYVKSGPKTSNALNEGKDAVSTANYDDDAELMDLLNNPGESIRQLKKNVKKEPVKAHFPSFQAQQDTAIIPPLPPSSKQQQQQQQQKEYNVQQQKPTSSDIVIDEDSFSAFVNTVDFDQEDQQEEKKIEQKKPQPNIKPIVLNTPVKVKTEKRDNDNDDTESLNDEDLLNIKYEPPQPSTVAPKPKALPYDNTLKTARAPVATRTLNELPKDNLLFYWLDAADRVSSQEPGSVHFFGKVQVGPQTFESCCLIVRNVPRSVYFVPREPILVQKDGEKNKFVETEYCETMKAEVTSLLAKERITGYKLEPVMKNYAFEIEDIPHRFTSFLKVTYPLHTPASLQALSKRGLSGTTFSHVLGTTTSPLEALILDLELMGPGWLLVSRFTTHAPTTWCTYEVSVANPNTVIRPKANSLPETIPMTIMGLSLKTVLNSGKQQSEVAAASLYVETQIDVNHVEEKGKMEVYSAVRKLQGVFPVGFSRAAGEANVRLFNTEKELLNWIFSTIHAVDPDVVIGHNIVGYDLDVLMARAKALGEPGWSKMGRLRLSKHVSPHRIVAACAGRLICDTYTLAKEFITKQKSYKLSELVESQLNEKDVVTSLDYAEVAARYRSSADLISLVRMNEYCARVVVRLADRVNLLSLTKQLTGIAGNLWSRTLCGHRAERVEYLLLHKFNELEFVVPDKPAPFSSSGNGGEGGSKQMARRKKAAYSGGMVLDPVVGYYDKLVVLLDFKSLYPSLIQEYNVCFLTVKRTPLEGGGEGGGTNGESNMKWRADEPDKSVKEGVLPGIVRSLVMKRREVRSKMTSDKSPKELSRLGIQQMALKLVANSLYGCLGFEHSRFYARPLAELVTRKGRETLQQTVNLTSEMGYRIIYGDTDSVMLSTGLDSLDDAKGVARKVIGRINEQYTKLEIDIDNVFTKVLLLKKKNYACVEAASGKRQIKGLYLVRRDWCDLSKEIGDFILDIIMADSGPSRDERIESIYEYLATMTGRIRHGEVQLRKFAISKSLSKAPDSYADSKAQYHVQAAKMLKERTGAKLGVGDFITYVICRKDAEAQIPVPLEIAEKDSSYVVDADWYLATQVFPPISRLCSPIPEIETERIAVSLGLDPLKFTAPALDSARDASTGESESATVRLMEKIAESGDNHIRGLLEYFFSTAQRFLVKCPSPECAALPPAVFFGLSKAEPGEALPAAVFTCSHCRKPYPRAVLENQFALFIRRLIRECYRGEYVCTNSLCGRCSRTLVLKDADRPGTTVTTVCPMPGCKSNVRRKLSEKDLYYQLLYLRHLVDPEGIYGVRKTKLKRETVRLNIEQEECLSAMYDCVNRFIKRSSYHNVHISSLVPKKKSIK